MIIFYGKEINSNTPFMKLIHYCCINRRMNPQFSQRKNREELSIELQKPSFPHINGTAIPSELRFDPLQPAELESIRKHKIEFGDFVVRQAVLDEEFWVSNNLICSTTKMK